MTYTDQQVFDWLQSQPMLSDMEILSAMQEFGVKPDQISRVTGLGMEDVNSRIEDVINQAYFGQYGRDATTDDVAAAWEYLNGGGLVDQGIQNLNNRQEGYNYDTQDIVSAYRQAYGRNPTQQEYVAAMATLGIGNFDRDSLQNAGNYTSAQLNALESDPYAGRYASYNPYQLPADAANVSQNTLGDYVQYTSPVTQRPAVASFENGQLVVRDGGDVLTGAQAAAAVGLALGTGAINKTEYDQIQKDLTAAKSMSDVYAAFSKPQAVAAFDPIYGFQTGVGKTLEEAAANSDKLNALVAQLGLNKDGVMPGNFSVANAAQANQIPYQFNQNLYTAMYGGMAPYKSSDIISPLNFMQKLPAIQDGVSKAPGLLDDYDNMQTRARGIAYRDLGTFGAAGNKMLDAGNAEYQSPLIKALRNSSAQEFSSNPGVKMYQSIPTVDGQLQSPGQGGSGASAFNPQIFDLDTATPDDIANYGAWSAYRTNQLGANQPILSFDEWLANGGKEQKKDEPAQPTVPAYVYEGGGGA